MGDQRVSDLPDDMTTFIGRRRSIADVRRLLSTARLVTLTGVAGVGKSRLALQVARSLHRAFPDGVCLVEVAELDDPSLELQAAAAGVDPRNWSVSDARAAVVEQLADRSLLLVLDNCEHALEATAHLVSAVLSSTPGVRVLASSREPLAVAGEHIWPVVPLSVPDEERFVSGTARHFEAPAMFEARAAAVNPVFTINSSNEDAVVRLCRRLDGLPLAIELAAVRTRALSVEQILTRLDNRFELLTKGDRTAAPRHHSLRAAVESSHEMCTGPERALWARLSVFAGDFDLEGAEWVCSGDGLTEAQVFAALEGLLDRSILERARHGDGKAARYRMLETIRAYGQDRLAAGDGRETLQRRHRDYYLLLAERCHAECSGPEQLQWFSRLRVERANLWAALDFCLAHPDEAEAGLRMAGALVFSWVATGSLLEGRYWLDRALNTGHETSPDRARALWATGLVRVTQGDLHAAVAPLIEARGLAHALGDDAALTCTTHILNAMHHLRTCAQVSHELQAPRSLGTGGATSVLDILDHITHAGALLTDDRTVQHGIRILEQCVARCESTGDEWQRSWTLAILAIAHWRRGFPDRALDALRSAVKSAQSYGDVLATALIVEIAAWILSDRDPGCAARLLGASTGLWQPLGAHLFGVPRLLAPHHHSQQRIQRSLGRRSFRTAYHEGTRLTAGQAAALLLGDPETPSTTQPPARTVLTEREWEVATKIAEGLSNKQIAKALIISQRTAETHVENTLRKLSFTSRTQIAVWMTNQDHSPIAP